MKLLDQFANAITRSILEHKDKPAPADFERTVMQLHGWNFKDGDERLGDIFCVEITNPQGAVVNPLQDAAYLKEVRRAWVDHLFHRKIEIH